MNGDIFGGRYSQDEVRRILDINARPYSTLKPVQAYYKKTSGEVGPTWAEKREFIHFLMNESGMSNSSKQYLRECDHWVPKYQLRGFKYGLFTSAMTFFFFPVIRRQPFLRRFACSMVPMAYFLNWGYVWGHENWWRRAKEVVVTYELFVGTRNKFTIK